jgi:hypothetical protein
MPALFAAARRDAIGRRQAALGLAIARRRERFDGHRQMRRSKMGRNEYGRAGNNPPHP